MKDPNAQGYDGDLKMLFEPDELAAYEYRKTSERRTFFEPEKRLLYAVLEDAVQCFQRFANATSRKEKQLFQDAADWFFEREDNKVFSFEFVCEVCGFDADFLRMGLRRWKERNGLIGVPRKPISQLSRRATRQRKIRAYTRGKLVSIPKRSITFPAPIMTPTRGEPV
jgi:hypothetical protein